MTIENTFYEMRPYLFALVGIWAMAQQTAIYTVSGLLFVAAASFIIYFRSRNRTSSRPKANRMRGLVQKQDEFAMYRKSARKAR